jgi:hypothetical protein
MTAVTIDTHKLIRMLKDSGLPEHQAETIVEVLWQTRADVDAAVKEAVAVHDSDLRHALRETELRLEVRIAEAKTDLTRWVVGAGILQTSLIIGVLLKIAKLI